MIRVTNNTNNNNGIDFIGALQIAFIVLKLLKVINWKWLWVLAPTWISIILVIVIIAIWLILAS